MPRPETRLFKNAAPESRLPKNAAAMNNAKS